MSTTPYARLLVSLNGRAAAAGGIEAAASDDVDFVYESTIGWPSSPAPYLEIYEAPVGWAPVPSTGWIATDGGGWKYYGTTPPPTIAAPDAAHFGKVAAQLVVGGGLKDGVLSSDMTSGATVLVRSAVVGLEGKAFRETTEFDAVRGWVGADQRDARLVEAALAGGIGVPTSRTITAGAGLTGGGSLAADRTLDVAAADASITVNANSIEASGAFVAKDISTTGTITTGVCVARLDGLTTTNAACISARNATAATAGVTVQDGGAVLSEGAGWATTAGGSSKTVRGGFLTVPVTGSSAAIRVYRVYDSGGGTLTRGSYYTDFDPALFGIADVMSTVILDSSSNGVRSAINGNGGLKFPSTDTMLTSGGSNDVVLATNSTDRHRITSTGATTRSFDTSAPERKQWGTAGVNYVDDVGFATGTLAQSATTTIYTITLANNSYVKVEIDCVAYDTGTPDRVEMFGRRGAAIRIAGTTTLLSAGSDKHALIENGVWGSPVSVAFSVSGTSFKVDVTTPALDIKVVVQRIAIFVGTTSA